MTEASNNTSVRQVEQRPAAAVAMPDGERETFEVKYQQAKAVVFEAEHNRYVPRYDSHWQRQCAEAMTPAWRAFQAGADWQRTQAAVVPDATQQVLDLILEECRYWQGRDEARRGGFACLYAKAKEVVDKNAPTPEPVSKCEICSGTGSVTIRLLPNSRSEVACPDCRRRRPARRGRP